MYCNSVGCADLVSCSSSPLLPVGCGLWAVVLGECSVTCQLCYYVGSGDRATASSPALYRGGVWVRIVFTVPVVAESFTPAQVSIEYVL